MSGTFVTHVVTDLKPSVGCVWTVIREVFPIFQLALSSPVNWDSKAQNDRWEKRGKDECWSRITGLDDTASETLQPLLKLLNGHLRCRDHGPVTRIQEFSWNWRYPPQAPTPWSAQENIEIFQQNKQTIRNIWFEGGTRSWLAVPQKIFV